MELRRRKFQGVLNILSFNRHFYIWGLFILLLLISSRFLITWNPYLYWLTVSGFLYGLSMPLLVSAYVYDQSGFYQFEWLKKFNLKDASTYLNLNINAGFDETSYIIKQILPQSKLQVYDFYDATKHTEPAIIRARKVSTIYPGTTQISTKAIPLKNNTVDHIFIVSAIHEIRSHEEQIKFLKECKRILKSDGQLIIVEHLRDWSNFIAFTIGFTHFFSKSNWKNALAAASFNRVEESKFTPFMSIFNCN